MQPSRVEQRGRGRRKGVMAQSGTRKVLGRIARPRLTGSSGAADVGGWLRSRFEELGYKIREIPFEFSALPGRLGVPMAGALLAVAALMTWGLLWVEVALVSLLVLLAVGVAVGAGLYFSPRLIADLPWQRYRSANWLITRPGTTPRYLVAAHRDSKSQPISIRLRAAAVVAAALGWLGLVAITTARVFGMPYAGYLSIVAGVLTLVGAVLLIFSWVDNHSPGALDNATGVAALLALAERLDPEEEVGFLVTDAEELGMAGARAAGTALPPLAGIINLDGLDDDGPFQVVERWGIPRRGRASHLVAALLRAADELGMDALRRDLPPGILVESIAYTKAGIPSVTVMKGRPSALSRVHRAADKPERLTGAGVAATTTLLGAALRLLQRATESTAQPLFGRSKPGDPESYFPRLDIESTPLLGGRERQQERPASPEPG